MDVDTESKEILIMRMSDKELTKAELEEMQNKAD